MVKPVIIGFYGKSNSGKTSTIIKIIDLLVKKGFKIASIKISDKEIFLDNSGKDTYKYAESGSDLVVLSSKTETDFMLKNKLKLSEILEKIKIIDSYDFILIEGANDKKTEKIRFGNIKKRENTIYDYENDFKKLYYLILDKYHKEQYKMNEVSLKVNGEKIGLSEFPEQFIKNTIIGMIKPLKGVKEIKEIEIKIIN